MRPVTDLPTMPLVEVRVVEEFDAVTAPRISALLDEAIALGPAHLVVDLSACPFIDTAAIETLLDVHRRLSRAGGRLTLRARPPSPAQVQAQRSPE